MTEQQMNQEYTVRVRQLNDEMRHRMQPERRETLTPEDSARASADHIMVAPGLQSLGLQFVWDVQTAVSHYDEFTEGDDPNGEHDFGALAMHGEKIFWKIDYYDTNMTNASPDASDLSVTRRVLTLMLAEDY